MKRFLASWDFASHSILIGVGLSLLVAFLLYPHPKQVARDSGVTEITYWFIGPVADSMQAAIDEFERRNPHYRVITGTATARDNVGDPTRFLLSVAGGMPPDLIFFDRFAVVEWASRGAFTDLTPFVETDQNHPEGIREENFYAPSAWLEPIYKGRNYAIANGCDTRAMYYGFDPLIRAGLVYEAEDPEVLAGRARVGEARPPKTWEEMCRKTLHADGVAEAGGNVVLKEFTRRHGVNGDIPDGATIDLATLGARANDVVALIAGTHVFRARIAEVTGPDTFRLDLQRELPASTDAVPRAFRNGCEVKVFDQESYSCKLTRYDPESGRLTSTGFLPLFGNSWLYMFGWLNGAEFMTDEGEECNLDSIEIVEALEWMTDCYDAVGGREASNVFLTNVSSGAAMDPFVAGKVAMRIDGETLINVIMSFRPNLEFGVVESPIPQKRIDAGHGSLGWSGGWAYAIPEPSENKQAAWELLRWLCSVEANKMIMEYEASLARAQGRTYFPSTHPDRRVLDWTFERFFGSDTEMPPLTIPAFHKFVDLLPTSKYRPVTPVGQRLWTEHVRSTEKALNHTNNAYEALNYGKRQVQNALEQVLHPPTGPLVNWHLLIGLYISGVLVLAAALILIQERRRHLYGGRRGVWFEGFICASPWLLGFLVFGAGPIVFSIVISFSHYNVLSPSRFVGWQNYIDLLGSHVDAITGERTWNDPLFWKSLQNTGYMVISVPLGILAGLSLALLLDTKVRGLHIYRTIYYLPAIVPAVASFILWIWILSPSSGFLNRALMLVGFDNPPNWLQDPLWSKPALILMGLWGVGGSMLIWLAGLKDIPQSMYEAAAIDGANRVQRFLHITIPLLSPYILFNMIMGMIGVFQIFEAAFIMTDGGPADSTLFYAYKLFNEAFRFLNMGIASAMAWILFVVVLIITLIQLWLSKKWVHYGGQ